MTRSKLILLCACIAGIAAVGAVCVRTWYGGSGEKKKPVGSEEDTAEKFRHDAEESKEPIKGGDTNSASLLKDALARGDVREVRRLVRLTTGDSVAEVLSIVHAAKPGWQLFRMSIKACAENAPEETAVWAVAHIPKGADRTFSLHTALWNWVAEDPQAALNWAHRLSVEQGRECALRAVFGAWAKFDPETAARRIGFADDFRSRSLVMGAIAHYWGSKDLHAATKWAWNLPEGAGRVYALANIAMEIRRSDEKAADAGAEKYAGGHLRDATLRRIASFFSAEDIEGAAAWIAKHIPGGPGYDPAFQLRVAHWVSKDPEGAVAWAGQLADERTREHALSTVAQALAVSDPQGAAELADAIPSGDKRYDTVRWIAFYWGQSDIDAAREWAGQLEDEQAQEIALEELKSAGDKPGEEEPGGNEIDKDDPSDYIPDWPELVKEVEQLPDGSLRNGLVHRAAVEWAKAEGPAAPCGWLVGQLPDGRDLDMALRVIIWDWVSTDADAASAWVDRLPEGRTRDHAFSSVEFAKKHGAIK